MIVVFPYAPIDQELAAKLSEWIVELGPNHGHRALIVRDVRCNKNIDSQVATNLAKVFDSIETIDVVEKIDGWPEAPNIVFRTAAKYIQYSDHPEPWLWLEADVVPLKSGFVESFWKEYNQEPVKPFLGDFVQVDNVPAHMSGIAVYPPVVVEHAGNAVLALETAWDVYAADQIVARMKQTQLIQHKWKHPPLKNQSEVDNLLGQLKDTCVLFHSDKSGTLIDFLRERNKPVDPAVYQCADQHADLHGATFDIFIKSYPRDYDWLVWSLRSIEHFASGFRNIVVIAPDDKCPVGVKETLMVKPEYGNDGYLSQQVFKLFADTFTDADYILHIDSDTIFTAPVTPDFFFNAGKINWMMTPYEKTSTPWKPITEKFMKQPVEFEFMRRFPIMVPRWLHTEVRVFCEKEHGVKIEEYIMSQPYRDFSEFNVLGAYAYVFHKEKFNWIQTDIVSADQWPKLVADQRYSHSGLNETIRSEWEKLLSAAPMSASSRSDSVNLSSHGEVREDTQRDLTTGLGCPSSRGGRQTNLNEEQMPWENRMDSICEINKLVQRLYKFCDAPMHVKRVRDELKKVGVIR